MDAHDNPVFFCLDYFLAVMKGIGCNISYLVFIDEVQDVYWLGPSWFTDTIYVLEILLHIYLAVDIWQRWLHSAGLHSVKPKEINIFRLVLITRQKIPSTVELPEIPWY